MRKAQNRRQEGRNKHGVVTRADTRFNGMRKVPNATRGSGSAFVSSSLSPVHVVLEMVWAAVVDHEDALLDV